MSHRRVFLAREDAREKLATELDDGPIQALLALNHPLEKIVPEKNELRKGVLSISSNLRNVCSELRPPILQHANMAAVVRHGIAAFCKRHPETEVHVRIGDVEENDSDIQRVVLFRVLQEALANVGKHAQPENVWIELRKAESDVVLSVKDDGIGFEPPKDFSSLELAGHLGLSPLAQTAKSFGAELNVFSEAGSGTSVHLFLNGNKKWKRRRMALAQ